MDQPMYAHPAADLDEWGSAPVAPPTGDVPEAGKRKRRVPPNRGKAGGRTKARTTWFDSAEDVRLEAKAAEAGLSVAAYLRACAIGSAGPRARRAPTLEKELLGAAVAELNRVGNNVNQIARALNIGKDTDPDRIASTMEQLQSVLAEIRRAMRV